MDNCNAPPTENAVPGVKISITFRKCVKLHFRPVQNQRKKHVNVVEDSSDSSDNELYAGMINDLLLNSVNPLNDEWTVNSKINEKKKEKKNN